MSYTWRPSKRDGSSGFVTAPYGGRAIACIFAYGSSPRRVESGGVESASLHAVSGRPGVADEPAGYFPSGKPPPPAGPCETSKGLPERPGHSTWKSDTWDPVTRRGC